MTRTSAGWLALLVAPLTVAVPMVMLGSSGWVLDFLSGYAFALLGYGVALPAFLVCYALRRISAVSSALVGGLVGCIDFYVLGLEGLPVDLDSLKWVAIAFVWGAAAGLVFWSVWRLAPGDPRGRSMRLL